MLMVFIEEDHMDEEMSPVFKLAELAHFYKSRMEQLGVKHDGRVHTTRLAHFFKMYAQHQGLDVFLGFNGHLGDAVADACELNRDHDAVHLLPSL